MGAPFVGHLAQQGLKAQGVWGGVGRGHHAVHNSVFHGAEHAHFAVQEPEQLVEQADGGGLAIGARDGHHFHFSGGVVVERGGDVAQGGRARLHLHHGDVVGGVLRHPFAHHAGGAGCDGRVDEVVPIHGGAWHGDEQAKRLHLSRVQGDVFHRDVRGASHLEDARIVEKVGEQFHERRSWMVVTSGRSGVPGAMD